MLLRLLAIAAAGFLAVLTFWFGVSLAAAQDDDSVPVFRESPSVKFDLLRGLISKDSAAHAQLVIVNSRLNEDSLVGEAVITFERTLYVLSTTDGATGGSTKLIVPITNPISPGSAESFDIFIQASPESPGVFKIDANVTLWPVDVTTGVENKSNPYKQTLLATGPVVSPTSSDCYGQSSRECTPGTVLVERDKLVPREPWEWFLAAYLVIILVMFLVVIFRLFVTRY